jgi:hypothetical protein
LSQQQLLQRLLQEGEAQADPPGQQSVHLSLDLPLAADLFDQGVPGLPALRPPASATPAPPTPSEPPAPAEAADGEGSGSLRLMQSLFQMASEELQDPAPDTEAEEPSAAMAAGLDPRVTATTVPRDPLLQLRWWTHLDRALRRRLRNLSHAVNVELLRVGLAQGLLPMGLLDAVLDGQLEALPAPANLLRLPLPVPEGHALEASMPTQVLALLLRQGDLEFEQPRLRSCRKRLEQRRRTLRTMAKRYGGWQRRLRALQAEQQWFQDTAPPQNPPPAHR